MAESVSYPGTHDLGAMICEALGINGKDIVRIVIDINTYVPVKVYVEMVASKKILEVDWMAGLKGVDITILDKG